MVLFTQISTKSDLLLLRKRAVGKGKLVEDVRFPQVPLYTLPAGLSKVLATTTTSISTLPYSTLLLLLPWEMQCRTWISFWFLMSTKFRFLTHQQSDTALDPGAGASFPPSSPSTCCAQGDPLARRKCFARGSKVTSVTWLTSSVADAPLQPSRHLPV